METTLGWSYLEQTYKFYIARLNSWSDTWKCMQSFKPALNKLTDFCSFLGKKETRYFSSLSIFFIFHRFSLWHLLKTWCKFSCHNRKYPGIVMSNCSHPCALWEDVLVRWKLYIITLELGPSVITDRTFIAPGFEMFLQMGPLVHLGPVYSWLLFSFSYVLFLGVVV